MKMTAGSLLKTLAKCSPDAEVRLLISGYDIAVETLPVINAMCIGAIADGNSGFLIIAEE